MYVIRSMGPDHGRRIRFSTCCYLQSISTGNCAVLLQSLDNTLRFIPEEGLRDVTAGTEEIHMPLKQTAKQLVDYINSGCGWTIIRWQRALSSNVRSYYQTLIIMLFIHTSNHTNPHLHRQVLPDLCPNPSPSEG